MLMYTTTTLHDTNIEHNTPTNTQIRLTAQFSTATCLCDTRVGGQPLSQSGGAFWCDLLNFSVSFPSILELSTNLVVRQVELLQRGVDLQHVPQSHCSSSAETV